MSLSQKKQDELKSKILKERERILAGFSENNTEKYCLSAEDRMDEVDQATSDYERSQQIRFRNRELFYIKKLDKALAKFESEDYSICEECGCTIKFERLFARPTAELCISCKDEAEREEQGNFIARQSKSLGRQVDMVQM